MFPVITLFHALAAQRMTLSPKELYLLLKNLNISTNNGSTPSISVYLFCFYSNTNGSEPPFSIYVLNILSVTNGSTHSIPMVLHRQKGMPGNEPADMK